MFFGDMDDALQDIIVSDKMMTKLHSDKAVGADAMSLWLLKGVKAGMSALPGGR